jgi:predicted TIM-barrel fold metal-dependent hydrolase
MWECDYPHGDTSWPHSRKRVEEMLADVAADEAAAIVEGNARRLFRLSPA